MVISLPIIKVCCAVKALTLSYSSPVRFTVKVGVLIFNIGAFADTFNVPVAVSLLVASSALPSETVNGSVEPSGAVNDKVAIAPSATFTVTSSPSFTLKFASSPLVNTIKLSPLFVNSPSLNVNVGINNKVPRSILLTTAASVSFDLSPTVTV